MPTFFKMSDDKKTDDTPAVVFTETELAAPQRKTKKYVIIAVSAVLAVLVILAAILIGMYMFTQAQKEIIQYTMQLGSNNKQDVTSDPNENVVQYHVSTPDQDDWVINDFNKDLQLMKIVRDGQTNCYLTALNRTSEMDPSQITGPDTKDPTTAVSLMYRTSDTPIVDTSFLGKTASAACKGISIYWLYPYCANGNVNHVSNGTNPAHSLKKRQTTVNNPPWYCANYATAQSPYDGQYYYVPCVTACCQQVCACKASVTSTQSNGVMKCQFVVSNCPPTFTANPLYYDGLCTGPSGLDCASKGSNHNCLCP